MKEADLSDPVSAWLRGLGFAPYAEVPLFSGCVDLLGLHEDTGVLIAVELKRHLTRRLLQQVFPSQVAVDLTYVAVGAEPRSTNNVVQACWRHGIGVLVVKAGRVCQIVPPRFVGVPFEPCARRLRDDLARMEPGGVAGKPCERGIGPAQDCARRVGEYLREHPGARWKDIFRDVPNHYASHGSMRQHVGPLVKLMEEKP